MIPEDIGEMDPQRVAKKLLSDNIRTNSMARKEGVEWIRQKAYEI